MSDDFDFELDKYPHRPGYKIGGTSRDAAVAVSDTSAMLQARVLACLAEHPSGLTADEVAHELNHTPLGIRPRLSELRKLKQIKDSGERRTNAVSGMSANVWIITDAGREALP